MERSERPEREVWGTLEELLLACAVDRHGTGSWESVAMEIQTRSPFSHLLTPQNCRRHYRDLRLRFSGGDADEQRAEAEQSGSPADVPWVEELRKLRVAELRREVERYDASIGYLRLKLRRLEDERERSSKTESGEEKPDQGKESGASPSLSPETVDCEAISGEESNSTLPKEDHKKLDDEGVKAAESVEIGGEPADTVSPQPAGESGESTLAESKSGEGKEKDASDAQCSASLSRQRRRVVLLGGSSGGEDAEEEESLAVDKRVGEGSDPLAMFLETIRSDHHGSVLERALASQDVDSDRYRSLIRQHVDFEIVRAKLDAGGSGGGSYTTAEFRRDLFLLCSNAIIFYRRRSPESIAAVHLRDKINKEIFANVRPPTPVPPPWLHDFDLAASRVEKPAPIIVCRRRSSISKARKEEVEEKPKPEPEEEKEEEAEAEAEAEAAEEVVEVVEKAKVIPVLSRKTRGLRTDKGRRRGNAREGSKRPADVAAKTVENTPVVEAAARSKDKKGGTSAVTSPPEKQKRPTGLRSAKGTASVETPKRRGKATEEGKDETTSRPGAGGVSGKAATKKLADTKVPGKRSVGRPPKRAASPATTPPPAKRGKGNTEARTPSTRSASVGTRRKRGRR